MKRIFWLIVSVLFFVMMLAFIFDSDNSAGNRAVGAVVLLAFVLRYEFDGLEKKQRQHFLDLENRIRKMEQEFSDHPLNTAYVAEGVQDLIAECHSRQRLDPHRP